MINEIDIRDWDLAPCYAALKEAGEKGLDVPSFQALFKLITSLDDYQRGKKKQLAALLKPKEN